MTNCESSFQVEEIITNEIGKRKERFTVANPVDCQQNPAEMAKIMIAILSANYGAHNLSSNWEPLAKDINSGRIKPFISFDTERNPIACAALIKINEDDVEIGRAACLPGKNGGNALPILLAVKDWLEEKAFPETQVLRGEIRTAKPTKEVPGGAETQAISFRMLGLTPTAIAPLFHHGVPDRQEMFFLASRFKNPHLLKSLSSRLPEIPANLFSSQEESKLFWFFWFSSFNIPPIIKEITEVIPCDRQSFLSHREGPFLIVNFSKETQTTSIDSEIDKSFTDGTRIALARVPLRGGTIELAGQIETLKQLEFKVAGFEPVWENNQVRVDLIMAKLSQEGKERLIIPSFIENVFPHHIEDLLLENSIRWRKL